LEWQKQAQSFAGFAGYDWQFNFLIRNDGSQSIQGMAVTKDYLQLMGLRPAVGRGFAEQDFTQGPVKVILLGYEFWQRTFNGDPRDAVSWGFAWRLVLNKRTFGTSSSAKDFV